MENNNRGNSGREGADNPRMASGQNDRRGMQPEQTGQEADRYNASQGGESEWMEDENSESYNADSSESSRGGQSATGRNSGQDSGMNAGGRDMGSSNEGSRGRSDSGSRENRGE